MKIDVDCIRCISEPERQFPSLVSCCLFLHLLQTHKYYPRMRSDAMLIAMVLNIFAFASAFISPVKFASRGLSQIWKMSSSDDDYNTLISNVKKNTPPGSVIVIKYGGHAMENEELKRFFCEDIAALCNVRTF